MRNPESPRLEMRKSTQSSEQILEKLSKEKQSFIKKLRKEASVEMPELIHEMVEGFNIAMAQMAHDLGVKNVKQVFPHQFYLVRTAAMPEISELTEQELRKIAGLAFIDRDVAILPLAPYDEEALEEQHYSDKEVADALRSHHGANSFELHLLADVVEELGLDISRMRAWSADELDSLLRNLLYHTIEGDFEDDYIIDQVEELLGEELMDTDEYEEIPESRKKKIRKRLRAILSEVKRDIDTSKFYLNETLEDARDTVYHEAIHLVGYSKTVAAGTDIFHRSGFDLPGRKAGQSMFVNLNEACVETMTQELLMEKAKPENPFEGPGAYVEERRLLQHIIHTIAEKKGIMFDEIWQDWKRAYLDGKIMALRSVEDVFGKGALREYAELPTFTFGSESENEGLRKSIHERFGFELKPSK